MKDMKILDDVGVNYQEIFILEVNYFFKSFTHHCVVPMSYALVRPQKEIKKKMKKCPTHACPYNSSVWQSASIF